MHRYSYCCRVSVEPYEQFKTLRGELVSPVELIAPWDVTDALKAHLKVDALDTTRVSVMEWRELVKA